VSGAGGAVGSVVDTGSIGTTVAQPPTSNAAAATSNRRASANCA
jgi:hypothetical protein